MDVEQTALYLVPYKHISSYPFAFAGGGFRDELVSTLGHLDETWLGLGQESLEAFF